MESNNELIIQIESQIRNNEFKSKEELVQYLTSLIENGQLNQEQEKEQTKRILALYDSIYSHEQPLNMENYKGASLEEQNFIISTQDDRILKTNKSSKEMDKEFKEQQNEIIANNKERTVTADDVFQKMSKTQKEELILIPLIEAFSMDNVSLETLQKIRYFINNKYINPYEYKIDLTSDIFYNVNTNEVFEVRKNEETNEYELYKGGEIVYNQNDQEEEKEKEEELEYQSEEEKQLYESRTNTNVKKRVLVPPKNYPNNRAAFSKISFLILNIITFILLITMIIFLNR